MSQPLQTLKGFRDFLPQEKMQRNWVQQRMMRVFERAGFSPLETPTLEYRDTIMGKYGEEADKLVYEFEDRGGRAVAMRYDQTVPLARVMANYGQQLGTPFRRYQIQNVFRADKPQRGRYREFTQCDIDILGSSDFMADAEILATTCTVYQELGFSRLELRVNDRQTLVQALGPLANAAVSVNSILQSIDKLDKISAAEVMDELVAKGLQAEVAQRVMAVLEQAEPSESLQEIMQLAVALGVPDDALVFTPTLARGLDYYTGMIFEIICPDLPGGSLGGGGRYDRLINDLSGVDVPAVGVGIGFDRTVEAAVELGLVPAELSSARVLVSVFSPELAVKSAEVAQELRAAGISTELYSQVDKLGKQFAYADRWGIPFVVVLGPEEVESGKIQLKDLRTGKQKKLSNNEIIDILNS